MKTNTNLAMITFDVKCVEHTQMALEGAMSILREVLENSKELPHHSTVWTAHKHLKDSISYLIDAHSEMKSLARKSQVDSNRKSCGGTRATNRTITGIG